MSSHYRQVLTTVSRHLRGATPLARAQALTQTFALTHIQGAACARTFTAKPQPHTPGGALSYACGVAPADAPLLGYTIGTALDLATAAYPDRLAYVCAHQRADSHTHTHAHAHRQSHSHAHPGSAPHSRTYAAFKDDVDRLAASLLKLGLAPGDRLAIWSPNCWEWLTLQFATAKAGIALVAINPAYKASELRYALNKVGCVALVTATHFKSSNYTQIVEGLCPELASCAPGALHAANVPSLRHVISLADKPPHGMHAFKALMHYASDGDVRALDRVSESLDTDDVVSVQFTSGTTGNPKAAALTHHNVLNNAAIVGGNIGLAHEDVICLNVPLMHCFGQVMGSLAALQRGAGLIFPAATFDAEAALRTSAQYGATAMYGVPTMFVNMLNHPLLPQLKPQLSRLRTGIMAGSICPAPLMARVETELGIKELVICYGMTETSPVSTQTSRFDPHWARTETVGRVAPHTEAKVVDPASGRVVKRGERGELCVRGYLVMKGYLGDEAKTKESITNGWMHTGDLAEMDDEGYVRIVGRIKDMIIRGGENVYPKEIETFLYGHPGIQDVAVFGVADEVMGEEVAAYVIAKAGVTLHAEDVRAFCKGSISHYKVPRYIRVVDAFPLTASGKIQKFVMKAELEEQLRHLRHHGKH